MICPDPRGPGGKEIKKGVQVDMGGHPLLGKGGPPYSRNFFSMLSAVRGCKPSLKTHRVSTFDWGRSCSGLHMCFNMVPVYGKRKVGRHEVLCSQPWTSLLCKGLVFPDSVQSLSHCLRTGNPQASDPPASPTTFVFWQGSRRVGRIGV